MTISIPKAKRVCIGCGTISPAYSRLNEDEKHKVWNRTDLCPDCFSKQEGTIFWKRATREKVKRDVTGILEDLRMHIASNNDLDQCTALLLSEFLVRKQVLKRISPGQFRFRDSEEVVSFARVDFPREIFLEAQSRVSE